MISVLVFVLAVAPCFAAGTRIKAPDSYFAEDGRQVRLVFKVVAPHGIRDMVLHYRIGAQNEFSQVAMSTDARGRYEALIPFEMPTEFFVSARTGLGDPVNLGSATDPESLDSSDIRSGGGGSAKGRNMALGGGILGGLLALLGGPAGDADPPEEVASPFEP